MSCPISTSRASCRPAGQLDWDHKDPFDRLLAAEAMVEGFTLVTADEDLRAFEPVATLW